MSNWSIISSRVDSSASSAPLFSLSNSSSPIGDAPTFSRSNRSISRPVLSKISIPLLEAIIPPRAWTFLINFNGITFLRIVLAMPAGDATNCGPDGASTTERYAPSRGSYVSPPASPEAAALPNIPEMNPPTAPAVLPLRPSDAPRSLRCHLIGVDDNAQAAERAAVSSSFSRQGQRLPNSFRARRGWGDLSNMVNAATPNEVAGREREERAALFTWYFCRFLAC